MRSKNYIVFATAVVITMMLTATTVGTQTLNMLQKANAQNAAVKANTSMPMPNTTTNKAIPPTITLNIKSPPMNKNMTMNAMSNGSMSKMNNMKMMIGGFVQNNITSSISMFKTIGHAIDSSVKVSLSDASKTAEQTVGANSHAVFSMLKPVNDFLVYTVIVVDPSFAFHKVIVDPGNGKVILNQSLSMLENFMQGMMLVHSSMTGNGLSNGMSNGMTGNGMSNGMMGNGLMGVIIK
ncbi:MAG TPA: PepSY domain-containing protein [Candidatus Nitrosocosmicus sp.]